MDEKNCKKCGTPLGETDGEFCEGCIAEIEVEEEAKATEQQDFEGEGLELPELQFTPAEDKPKDKKSMIFRIIIAVFGVLVGGYLIYIAYDMIVGLLDQIKQLEDMGMTIPSDTIPMTQLYIQYVLIGVPILFAIFSIVGAFLPKKAPKISIMLLSLTLGWCISGDYGIFQFAAELMGLVQEPPITATLVFIAGILLFVSIILVMLIKNPVKCHIAGVEVAQQPIDFISSEEIYEAEEDAEEEAEESNSEATEEN